MFKPAFAGIYCRATQPFARVRVFYSGRYDFPQLRYQFSKDGGIDWIKLTICEWESFDKSRKQPCIYGEATLSGQLLTPDGALRV